MRVALTLVVALAFAPGLMAQMWNEQGDAGELPGSAQIPVGSGPLVDILGAVGTNDVDMFAIHIDDPMGFSAWTSGDQDPGGSGGWATFDTQLWLFDDNGYGVLGNDDNPGVFPYHSGITVPADDETGSAPAGPGLYYVAISFYDRDPVSAEGPIFYQFLYSEISGPDGPGGGQPIAGWHGEGLPGEYDIFLTGASYVPEPATLVLLAVGGLMLARRRR